MSKDPDPAGAAETHPWTFDRVASWIPFPLSSDWHQLHRAAKTGGQYQTRSMSPLHHPSSPEDMKARATGPSDMNLGSGQLTHRHSSSPAESDIEQGSHRHVQGAHDVDKEQRAPLVGSDARESHNQGRLTSWLNAQDPRAKFVVLVSLVMVFFMLHNILQEALTHMEGFTFTWSLSMMEVVGVLGGSFLERVHEGTHMKRVAPFRSYVLLAGLLAMSSSLSNIALRYIKYPTKVIFRSCKLIPTMVIAMVWRKKVVSREEYVAAAAVCLGLIMFAREDAKLEDDFNPIGIGMVILSVCADAFLPNLQEHVFSLGASRVEVTFFTNLLTFLLMVLSTTANGNMFEFLHYVMTHMEALGTMMAYIILSHVAIASHMMVLKEYGGVTAVLVGSTRKAMTIAMSFILFPKPFGYRFVLGGGLVLGGLTANVVIKERRRKAQARATKAQADADSSHDGRSSSQAANGNDARSPGPEPVGHKWRGVDEHSVAKKDKYSAGRNGQTSGNGIRTGGKGLGWSESIDPRAESKGGAGAGRDAAGVGGGVRRVSSPGRAGMHCTEESSGDSSPRCAL